MSRKNPDTPITNSISSKSREREIIRRRREFYSKVLTATPDSPANDLQNLCRCWQEATGADWVWLWLSHEVDGEKPAWELTSVFSKDCDPNYRVPNDPSVVTLRQSTIASNSACVAEYCSVTRRPVFIKNIETWKRTLRSNEQTFKVVCKNELLSMGCRALLAVPLIFPKSNSEAAGMSPYSLTGNIRGLICSHFTTDNPGIPFQSEESYLLMGHASTQSVIASFAAEQHQILFELDRLATQFLTTQCGNLVLKRHDFLMKVINLVKHHLRVQFASVFYRTSDKESIECLATTGVWNPDGVTPSKLTDARYARRESITGTVFDSGEPFIHQHGQVAARIGRDKYKWRDTPNDTPEESLPWVCYPIRTPETVSGDQNERITLGVLRCVGNKSLLAKAVPRLNFDPIQLHALDFITRQLAPVLETLASYINRERVISIIKHDLTAPLNMIEDSVYKAGEQLARGTPPNQYFIQDLQCCVHIAKSLARDLDQSPTEFREFDPQPTWMEADIVSKIQNLLRHYACLSNDMDIRFNASDRFGRGHIKENFPKRLWLDRNLISRALTNLIVNAVKYGDPDTTIYVSARKVDGRGFYLDIENRGIGVTPSESKRIFEDGYRSPRAEEKALGVGMGL
ncbi:MAG: HAMP domain-containing sensor histidine kinase [Verrucomicrobia bacterium]|nr:HAMP domain-containing sensor histidine kinase [Verrucomicrobiota bacterium]